ncbi:hypothetical protein [Duganella vulcania]|uniref:Uncharacterized protein n=1 Tax=Duganella vulcania TaxID=2692166 RepID=A0A845GP57_9BURK|nr:hypothetical protein [Duganella vulcania]MYM95202.1 hypothetical protein [Duganella vulcania]
MNIILLSSKKIMIFFILFGGVYCNLISCKANEESPYKKNANNSSDANYERDAALFKSQVIALFDKSEIESPNIHYDYTEWCNKSIFLNKPLSYAQSVLQASGQKGPFLNTKVYDYYPKDSVFNGGFIIHKSLISSVTFGITFLIDAKDPEKKVIKITSCGVTTVTL